MDSLEITSGLEEMGALRKEINCLRTELGRKIYSTEFDSTERDEVRSYVSDTKRRIEDLEMQLDDLNMQIICDDLSDIDFDEISLESLRDLIEFYYLLEDKDNAVNVRCQRLEKIFKRRLVAHIARLGANPKYEDVMIFLEGRRLRVILDYPVSEKMRSQFEWRGGGVIALLSEE